jgi:hypothetical protein
MALQFVSILMMLFVCTASVFGDDTDIDRLLQKAEQALQGLPPKAVSKKSAPAKSLPLPVAAPVAQPTAPPLIMSSPLDKRALSEILLADTQERERGFGTSLADSTIRVGAGMAVLDRGFSLTKDDDTFTITPSSSFWGASFEFTPPLFGLSVFHAGKWRSRVHVALGAGAYFGSADADRKGVMEGRSKYTYYFFPAGGEATIAFEYGSVLGFDVSYGYGFEALSQKGQGNSDTVSGIFQGETVKLRLRTIFSRGLEGFVLWQSRGRGVFSSGDSAKSQLFVVGLGIGLSG